MTDNILKWIGGKQTLAGWFVSMMPFHKKYYEVFYGAGNVFNQKEPAQQNIINDLNKNLINLWRVIQDEKKMQELCFMLDFALYSKNMFDEFLQVYKNQYEWDKLNDVTRAFMYLYLNRTSFNGMFQSYSRVDNGSSLYRLKPIIKKIYQKFQFAGVVIDNLPFQKFLENIDDEKDVFIYLDPPYWVTLKEKYYEKQMSEAEHWELRDKLLTYNKTKWMLSYDDVPEIRDMYKGCCIINTPNINQSSANFSTGNKEKETVYKQELLIANYELLKENSLFGGH